jgi:hypothetical protein
VQSEYETASPGQVRQRSDLTFKHNANQSRHGWLRLTPAYSVKLVDEILSNVEAHLKVFDPFSGTATTPLSAAYRGHRAVSIDINPFLVWFGKAKLRHYGTKTINEAKAVSEAIQSAIDKGSASPCLPPPISNIGRWWDENHLEFLCYVKGEIDKRSNTDSEVRDLLLVAFCRAVIDLSNAAFNHQSMSFKDNGNGNGKGQKQSELWPEELFDRLLFTSYVDTILESAVHNPVGDATVCKCDARDIHDLPESEFDLLITSPPYPNRMSYIRELRPYMYWLGYLKEVREAGEMDWEAIGGTWGIATSRLNNWYLNSETYFPKYLEDIIRQIAKSDGKSGELLSRYVGKYFEDMWKHFLSARKVMRSGGRVHYIVGNSKFYDCLVPTEKIYLDMLTKAGFKDAEIKVIRKRNSKRELYEFDVTARA